MSEEPETPTQSPEEAGQDIDLYSKEGVHSLFRLLNSCPKTQEAVADIPLELLEKTEFELLRRPDDVMRRLKISFWNEYRRCQRLNVANMVLGNVLFGVCSQWYWHKKVVPHADVLAWVITPPTSEMLVWQELLELGQNKLRRVLKLPLVEKRYWKDKTGEVHVEKRTNVSLVKEIRAIVENLQNRLHGSVVQRQQIESKNMTVTVPSKSVQEEMTEIKALLSRIEDTASKIPELEETAIVDGGIIPDDKEVEPEVTSDTK